MNKLEKIFEGHWDEIKGELKTQWSKLTDNDIKQIDGSFEKFVGKLKKYYAYEAAELEDKITEFFDANDLKNKIKDIKDEGAIKAEEIKELVKDYVGEYIEKMKGCAVDTEEKLTSYLRENPLKTAGMLLFAGFAVATLVAKKKK